METDLLVEMERALGAVAVMSLEGRGLLVRNPLPDVESDASRDRVGGALIGIAVGRSLSSAVSRMRREGAVTGETLRRLALTARTARSGAEAQTAELAARCWVGRDWAAAVRVSDGIMAAVERLHRPGRTIVAMADRRRHGIDWFEAGVPSLGNAALPRAVVVGAALAHQPARASLVAQLDTAVTHAHPSTTAAAAIAALITGVLITRTDPQQPADAVLTTLTQLAEQATPIGTLAEWLLTRAVGPPHVSFADKAAAIGPEPTAAVTLALAVCSLTSGTDPVSALAEIATVPGAGRTIVAVTGGLLGAAYGASAFPQQWTQLVDQGELLRQAASELHPSVSGERPHDGSSIWFLLDRSGSMSSIASDVEGGFDQFFLDQAAVPGDVRVTVVQFDSNDPHEVLVDALAPAAVPTMRGRFSPRGSTPLFDAVGLLLDKAEAAGGNDVDQLVVVFTDGHENASRCWDRDRLFARIGALKDRGWTFVFLGANQDSYATGHHIGLADGNVSDFAADSAGVNAAYAGLSRATREWRAKDRPSRQRDRERFWGDVKEAENDLSRRVPKR